ncbi:hypothetical protein GSQ51_09255 [Clostridioides difficile]|nr:hypothetical protein [Clostridioides difficile]NJK14281.1 hypothetical protein [Clostridioides difficile]
MLQIGEQDRRIIRGEITRSINNGVEKDIITVTLPRYNGSVTVNVHYRKTSYIENRFFGNPKSDFIYSIRDTNNKLAQMY